MNSLFCIIDSIGLLQKDFVSKNINKETIQLELGYGVKLGYNANCSLNNINNQPLIINNIALICIGEIYNYNDLFKEININPITDLNYEIIIHLYILYGIEKTLSILDGDFSFILYDLNILDRDSSKIYISRDPFGMMPLYIFRKKNELQGDYSFAISSDLKIISKINSLFKNFYKYENSDDFSIMNFPPGTYSLIEKKFTTLAPWQEIIKNKSYFNFIPNSNFLNININSNIKSWYIKGFQFYLYNAIKKRFDKPNKPIAFILSNNFGCFLILSIICQINKENNNLEKINTYSIGLLNSQIIMN